MITVQPTEQLQAVVLNEFRPGQYNFERGGTYAVLNEQVARASGLRIVGVFR